MSFEGWNDRSSEPGVLVTRVRIQGTGANPPTKEYGRGVVVTRLGVGNYRFTWAEAQGLFVGFDEPGKQAVASGALKNCTCDSVAYDANNKRLDVQLWSSAGAARELAANEWLTFGFAFRQVGPGA